MLQHFRTGSVGIWFRKRPAILKIESDGMWTGVTSGREKGLCLKKGSQQPLCRLQTRDDLTHTKLRHAFSWLFSVRRRWPIVGAADLYRAVNRPAPSKLRAPIREEASPKNLLRRYWWDI